jgi:hypothetical protein
MTLESEFPGSKAANPYPWYDSPILGSRNATRSEGRSHVFLTESRAVVQTFFIATVALRTRGSCHRFQRSTQMTGTNTCRQTITRMMGIARSIDGDAPVEGAKENDQPRHARVQTWVTRNQSRTKGQEPETGNSDRTARGRRLDIREQGEKSRKSEADQSA